MSATPPSMVVMGVAGSGKSTVGRMLATRCRWPFLEGDDLHPSASRERMRAGQPLGDAARWPWLASIADWVDQRRDEGSPCVVSCSALRRAHRDRLRQARSPLRFVFLHADRDILVARLAGRRGHFMPASLLDSQLATLEAPGADEGAICLDAARGPEDLVAIVLRAMGAS